LVKLLLALFLVHLFSVREQYSPLFIFLSIPFLFIASIGYAPGWSDAIWPKSSLNTFKLIANLGLIFFMFFLGLELDLNQIKKSWKITIPVAVASITIPGKI
jgi:Kef-type K+ transport system membrane component KefB